ncbi:MAG: hypothetical protein Q8O14_11930 [bacterium]|jgi:hypothetical protein|nr:hypothetical protein [bacterium]
MEAVLIGLVPGQAIRLDPDQLEAILAAALIESEADSGMTGPIRVLGLPGWPDRWIQEFDTRRRPVLRRLRVDEDPMAFIAARREAYERMWDG